LIGYVTVEEISLEQMQNDWLEMFVVGQTSWFLHNCVDCKSAQSKAHPQCTSMPVVRDDSVVFLPVFLAVFVNPTSLLI